MKISYYTVKDNLNTAIGYGAAGFRVVTSLQELGHEIPFDDPTAEVQIAFCPPNHFKFHSGQFKIGYVPWESTELPAGWLDKLNECDEVWATSDWTAEVFENAGVTRPLKVYPHGVDKRWIPFKRERGSVVNFLHVGEPALRKGGQMTIDAFRAVFGDREDVHLTVKAYHQHFLRVWDEGTLTTPDKAYNNVTVITEQLHFNEMIDLFHSHDVLLYPSYGEGFGLIPLQALSTGMPVIMTDEWAQYKYFSRHMNISGRWDRSIWSLHPGNVLYPDYEEYKNLLKWFADGPDVFQTMSQRFFDQSEHVRQEYDWLKLTETAFADVVSKFTKS